MRSENNAIDKNHKAGYIVFDKEIDKIQKDYFEKNNIGAITIDNIPFLNDIPDKITKDIGKRLYSFCPNLSTRVLHAVHRNRSSYKFVLQ